jgi:hypothetical protein
MSGRDWRAFDAELRARVPELAVELLGKPTFRAGQEWRWGRKGSLSVVISGARARSSASKARQSRPLIADPAEREHARQSAGGPQR